MEVLNQSIIGRSVNYLNSRYASLRWTFSGGYLIKLKYVDKEVTQVKYFWEYIKYNIFDNVVLLLQFLSQKSWSRNALGLEK